MAKESEQERLKLEQKVIEDEPKVQFYDHLTEFKASQSIRDFAKCMGTGQNRMYEWLRDKGYLIPKQTSPYQRYIEIGYFRLTLVFLRDKYYRMTLITAKGTSVIGAEYLNRDASK